MCDQIDISRADAKEANKKLDKAELEIHSLKKKLAELESKNANQASELETKSSELGIQRKSLQAEVAAARNEVELFKTNANGAATELSKANEVIKTLEGEVAELKATTEPYAREVEGLQGLRDTRQIAVSVLNKDPGYDESHRIHKEVTTAQKGEHSTKESDTEQGTSKAPEETSAAQEDKKTADTVAQPTKEQTAKIVTEDQKKELVDEATAKSTVHRTEADPAKTPSRGLPAYTPNAPRRTMIVCNFCHQEFEKNIDFFSKHVPPCRKMMNELKHGFKHAYKLEVVCNFCLQVHFKNVDFYEKHIRGCQNKPGLTWTPDDQVGKPVSSLVPKEHPKYREGVYVPKNKIEDFLEGRWNPPPKEDAQNPSPSDRAKTPTKQGVSSGIMPSAPGQKQNVSTNEAGQESGTALSLPRLKKSAHASGNGESLNTPAPKVLLGQTDNVKARNMTETTLPKAGGLQKSAHAASGEPIQKTPPETGRLQASAHATGANKPLSAPPSKTGGLLKSVHAAGDSKRTPASQPFKPDGIKTGEPATEDQSTSTAPPEISEVQEKVHAAAKSSPPPNVMQPKTGGLQRSVHASDCQSAGTSPPKTGGLPASTHATAQNKPFLSIAPSVASLLQKPGTSSNGNLFQGASASQTSRTTNLFDNKVADRNANPFVFQPAMGRTTMPFAISPTTGGPTVFSFDRSFAVPQGGTANSQPPVPSTTFSFSNPFKLAQNTSTEAPSSNPFAKLSNMKPPATQGSPTDEPSSRPFTGFTTGSVDVTGGSIFGKLAGAGAEKKGETANTKESYGTAGTDGRPVTSRTITTEMEDEVDFGSDDDEL